MATKQPHPHAALMMEYAKEAAKDIDVHKNWQVNNHNFIGSDWEDLGGPPAWLLSHSYRRKPRTVMIGDIQISAPETTPPERGQDYFVPYFHSLDHEELSSGTEWQNDRYDLNMLKRGMVHLTKDAATAHAKAVIALTAPKDD